MGVIYVFSTGGNGWVKIVVVLSAKGTLHVGTHYFKPFVSFHSRIRTQNK